ncbi:MFS transporter [Streptomyces sp. NPDC059426]|uniref:MFS transporter n=1 Tax=Streptomyces sp. NPDC059426 TaxID=3346827 RepID=UPI0036BD8FA1
MPALSTTVLPFAVLFGLSLLGVAFGPNYTTMLLGAEAFPTSVRSTFHGLSSGFAKIGAFIGALLVPLLLNGAGLRMVTLLAMGCFLAGAALTYFVREPNGLSLEEASGEAALPITEAAAEEPVRSH